MRAIILLALLMAACSQQPDAPTIAAGTYSGKGRDRLCIAGEAGAYRAGLNAYGQGDVNCSATGSLEPLGAGWVLVPKGEGPCRIPIEIQGNVVRIGQPPQACAYYCGPGANMAGRTYNRSDMGAKAVDLAGDPLC
jgi:hypothetical protein